MTEQDDPKQKLADAIDVIEGGYEFLLAYAAQGRHTDRGGPGGEGPRDRLGAMVEAISAVPELVSNVVATAEDVDLSDCEPWFEALARDSAVSAAAIRLVLSRSDIGSQIVDNLNASIHLRALLTDIFLLDEAFKP